MPRKSSTYALMPRAYRPERFDSVLGPSPESRFNRKFIQLDPTSVEIISNEMLDSAMAIRCLEYLIVFNAVRGKFDQADEAFRILERLLADD